MKIHLEPEVVLVWRPAFVAEGVERVMSKYGLQVKDWLRNSDDGDGDGIPELYGRLCYSSLGPGMQGRIGAKSYHENILSSGHGSVLETATWGFAVFGASRGYLAQQTRHRAGFAYAAESTHFERFSDGGEKGTVEPGVCLTGIPETLRMQFTEVARDALRDYDLMWKSIRDTFSADAKVKKIVSGAARGLLPTCLECKLGFTANARSLRHLCQMRGNSANTVEIRIVAAQVAKICLIEAPAIFQDFSVIIDEDGWPTVKSIYQKV